jgi:biopolymer transport protein ExbD
MVLTPLAEKQKYMRVPEFQPENQPVPPDSVPPDQTVLTALKNGNVMLNRQEMTVDEAMQRLHVAYEDRPSKVLFFNAEDNVNYDRVVFVLDQAHGVGVNTIGMMTDAPVTAQAAAAPVGQ